MANSHDWCLSREHETPAAHDSDDAASIVLGRRHVLDSMTRTVRLIAGRREDRYSLDVLIGPWRFSSFLEPCPYSIPATRVMSHLLVRHSNMLVPFPSCQCRSRKPHSCVVRLFVLLLDDDLSRRRQAPMARLWEVALVKLR